MAKGKSKKKQASQGESSTGVPPQPTPATPAAESQPPISKQPQHTPAVGTSGAQQSQPAGDASQGQSTRRDRSVERKKPRKQDKEAQPGGHELQQQQQPQAFSGDHGAERGRGRGRGGERGRGRGGERGRGRGGERGRGRGRGDEQSVERGREPEQVVERGSGPASSTERGRGVQQALERGREPVQVPGRGSGPAWGHRRGREAEQVVGRGGSPTRGATRGSGPDWRDTARVSPSGGDYQQPQQQQTGRGRGRGQGRGRGAVRGEGRGAGDAATQPSQFPASGPGPSSITTLTQSVKEMSVEKKSQPLKKDQKTPVKPPQKEYEFAIPRRKQIGKLGIPIQVQTNHIPLMIKPKYETAIHYDVDITPDKPKRLMRTVWEEFKRNFFAKHTIAFDDVKNAFTPALLPFTGEYCGEVSVSEDETSLPKTYRVVLKYAATVNLTALFNYMQQGCTTALPQEALQCIDIVLKNASALKFVKVGRNFFSEPRGSIISLGDGLQLWHGFFQSAIIGWKPFLNVDVAHKGFPTAQPVPALMAEMSGRGDQLDIDKTSKFLKGLKVMYEIPNNPASRRSYRVNSLVEVPKRAMFVLQNGTQISVYQYFLQEKRYTIRQPELPCLWVGSRTKKIYLPAELCTILPGQVVNKKLNEKQTSNMVRNAATSTDVRKDNIMKFFNLINLNNDPVVRAFGLEVGRDFEVVNARWLSPPTLRYQNDISAKPSKGVWRADKFYNAMSLEDNSWTVINLDFRTRNESINNFARMLAQAGYQRGMSIGAPAQPFMKMDRFDARQLETELAKHRNKKLVFVIVPDFPPNVYNKVKQKAELVIGCLTQCIKSKTMYNMKPATVDNILLKVNAKLNGRNHLVMDVSKPPCLRRPCMMMGADVTHPSPDQLDIPSVAAVTASYDASASQYIFSWRLQPARKEIIIDLQEIVREQLDYFYKRNNGMKPERIIFFRDGVSEGQFAEVMNDELRAIRQACSRMGTAGSYQPKITFLVVQKRHHTRFFPTNRSETEDRNCNVRAGTVVDRDITHPTDIEYYLLSHASIQGVSRPTKYRVLWDDADMSEDEIQALTYFLCHMFTRCNRSVSYPAPTYYAHLAAFRARVYLDGQNLNLNNLQQEQNRRVIKDEILRGKPMFFV